MAQKPQPYLTSGRNDYRYTVKAFDLITERRLTVRVLRRDENTQILATGECPNCQHDVAYEYLDKIVMTPGTPEGLGDHTKVAPTEGGDGFVDVNVLCWCEHKHPGRPNTVKRGCGVVFAAEVKAS